MHKAVKGLCQIESMSRIDSGLKEMEDDWNLV